METLDFNSGNSETVSTAAREHLKKGSGWMKAMAIITFVGLGFAVLFILIFLTAGSAGVFEEAIKNRPMARQEREFVTLMFDYMNWMMLPGLLIVALSIFGTVMLLKSSNGFAKIGLGSDNRSTIIETFSNYRKYWMINGIILISTIVLGIIFAIMLLPKIMEMAR